MPSDIDFSTLMRNMMFIWIILTTQIITEIIQTTLITQTLYNFCINSMENSDFDNVTFFGKKVDITNVKNKILNKILRESAENDNKYRFYSDGHDDHSDHYSDYSDYSDND